MKKLFFKKDTFIRLMKQFKEVDPLQLRFCQKILRVRRLESLDPEECFKCEHLILNEGVCDPL